MTRAQSVLRSSWFLPILGALATAVAVYLAHTQFYPDDAGFFFRYARNLGGGHGIRFNLSDPPISGMSAPLWGLLLGVVSAAGLPPELAARWFGLALTAFATLLLVRTAHILQGALAAGAAIVAVCVDSRITFWAQSGLEPALGFVWVSAGLLLLTVEGHRVLRGVIAGLAIVHKPDMVPFGIAMMIVTARERSHFRSAVFACLGVAALWYGFAALYLGSPVPVSVLYKMHDQSGNVPATWFARVSLLQGSGPLLLLGAIFGLRVLARRAPKLAFVGASYALSQVLVYSIRPPAESWVWYASQIQPVLCLFAACGFASGIDRLALVALPVRGWVASLVLLGVLAIGRTLDASCLRGLKWSTDVPELDRVRAGQWIDEHLPQDATVLTGFGNVAYYSRRYVYDASFLNRRPESGNLVLKYRPDAIVLCPFRTGVSPERFKPWPDYRVAAIFDSALRAGPLDFFAVVLVRDAHLE